MILREDLTISNGTEEKLKDLVIGMGSASRALPLSADYSAESASWILFSAKETSLCFVPRSVSEFGDVGWCKESNL